MKDLFLKAADLAENHQIYITCFSYKANDSERFRVYWKYKNYLHNPIKNNKYVGDFDSYFEAIKWAVEEAEIYLNY